MARSQPGATPARRAPAPDVRDSTTRLAATVFAVRHLTIVALALLAFTMPAIGENRVAIGVAVLTLVLPWDLVLHWRSSRTGRLSLTLPFGDQVLGAAFVVAAPTTFVPVLLVLVSAVGVATGLLGRRVAASAFAFGTVVVGLAAFKVSPDVRLMGMLGYVIAASSVLTCIGVLFEEERRLRERNRTLITDIDAIVWEAVPDPCRYTYVSGRAEEILGYPVERWSEPGFWQDHIHPADRERVLDEDGQAIDEGRDHELEYRMVAADGRSVYLHDIVSVITDNTGKPVSLRGIMVDITAQREAEARVRQYADLVERIQMALLVVRMIDRSDAESFRIVAANPTACELSAAPGETLVGRRLLDAFPDFAAVALHERLSAVLERSEPYDLDDLVPEQSSAFERHFSVHAFPLGDGLVGVSLDDVTGPSMAAQALRRQATHDGLTGLPNRGLLNERLRQAVREAARTHRPIALLILDLDQFKEINDALGHHTGDRLLIAMSRRLENVLRTADTIARLGGDEFAVLLTTDATVSGALTVARKITNALEHPFDLDGLSLHTNASVGIAVFPDHATEPEALTQRADVAMYMAKRSSRPYAIYDPERDHSSIRRVTLLGELRRALELEELVLAHQPAFDLRTGEPVGTEALVRWQHPVHGLMSPGEFVDLAEVSGMIQPLTRWAIRAAIQEASNWSSPDTPVSVSVNLSVRNLYDPELINWLRDLLRETGFPPDLVVLEITESEVMDDPMLAVEVLGHLRDIGVNTSIDDFGTGQSSLSYLKHLPIDELKIDRSFVSGIRHSQSDLTIVRSIIDLGHNLGLRVVGEGVEDDETASQLRVLGCDRAQGFHLAYPMAASELVGFLDRRRCEPSTP